MTEIAGPTPVRRTSAAPWQTAAGLLMVVCTAAVGRWLTGPTFGYALFAAVWGPVAAVRLAGPLKSYYARMTLSVAVCLCLAWPWLSIEPLAATGRMTLILAVLIVATVAAFDLLTTIGLGPTAAGGIASVAWMAWVVLPLTASAGLTDTIGGVAMRRLLAIQPILTLNAVSATAGDWTHQSIAYRSLTRIGQDVPFEWPTTVWPCLSGHLLIVAAGWGTNVVRPQENVPRGT